MIKLDVQEYCHGCVDFEPDVEKPIKGYSFGGEVFVTDTVVRCSHRRRCENIKRYLDRQTKTENDK